MKKLVIILSIILLGCVKESQNKSNSKVPKLNEYIDIQQMSGEFLKGGALNSSFDFQNISNFKMSKVIFYAKVHFYYGGSDTPCTSYVQSIQLSPEDGLIKDWNPGEIRNFKFTSPTWGSMGGCIQTDSYERTPNKILVELIIEELYSLDYEDSGRFEVIDALPLWIEKQKQLGIRDYTLEDVM